MMRSIPYLIIVILLMGFIALGDSADLGSLCEELLIRRAEAWNKILSEDYDYDDFHNDMNHVAQGKLMKEDLETFIYLRENPTDMEKVISLELRDRKVEIDGINAVIRGKIVWNLEGQQEPEVMEGYYNIEMQKHNDNWYIIDFHPI